jgi:hypothetical protein
MQKITVYYFTKYDIKADQEVHSKRMARLDYITRIPEISSTDHNRNQTTDKRIICLAVGAVALFQGWQVVNVFGVSWDAQK